MGTFRISVVAMLLALLVLSACSGPAAQRGDAVSVYYTGTFTNGTIFDTNDPANKVVFPAPESHFTPLPFTIGKGMVIPGFENAVIGLKKGDSTSVLIKAREAYGTFDAKLLFSVPKSTSTPLYLEVPKDSVVEKQTIVAALKNPSELAVGKILPTTNFKYNITAINDTHVSMRIVQAANPVDFGGSPWKSALDHETKDAVVYRHLVMGGDTFTTGNGPYYASLNATHVTIDSTLRVGDTFIYGDRRGRIVSETLSSFSVDGNHPLAGNDLQFAITLNDLVPKK